MPRVKELWIVEAASVTETNRSKQEKEDGEDDSSLESSTEEPDSEEDVSEKKKKKRLGFRDRKVWDFSMDNYSVCLTSQHNKYFNSCNSKFGLWVRIYQRCLLLEFSQQNLLFNL